ncbi:hypothetical protein [Pelagicoccus sp. SDUM812002]|uniref:DUF7309 domain-containing protein n=1 Tax=Pelagicoccus sp. SDUM812002 TaxID=3041266 RepID=UPI00280FB067|nr:hypothetical protein [Pelagicoccus sp. SDUM812002]MDQ8185709.1 hypothetical protein [Pelagicoccus sp. SDUM812002]
MAAPKKRVPAKDHPVEASDLKRLFASADFIIRLSPWEFLFEEQVFGLRAKGGKGEVYWVNVIGGAGEVFAVNVYRGAKGMAGLSVLMGALIAAEEDGDDYDPIGVGLEQCMFQLEFVSKRELDSWDRKALKKVGRSLPTKRNAMVPRFLSLQPGYLPWRLEAEEGREFAEVLKWVASGLSFLEEDPAFCPDFPSREIPVLEFGAEADCDIIWEALKPLISGRGEQSEPLLELDEFSREKYRALPQNEQVHWELASSLSPAPIKEKDKRPYVPYVVMVCEREYGAVLATEICRREDRTKAILVTLLESMDRAGCRPGRVFVDERGMRELAKAWFAEIEVEVEYGPCDACDDAFDGLFEALGD